MINKIHCNGINRPSFGIAKPRNVQTSPVKLAPLPFDTISFKSTSVIAPDKEFNFEKKKALFDNYSTTDLNFTNYVAHVHNKQIASKIKENYTPAQFDELFNFAKDKGVFDVKEDSETGYILTCDSMDDKKMGAYIWVTDTCNFMPYLKDNAPKRCTELINNLSQFYTSEPEQAKFDFIISNPVEFQKNYGRKDCASNGVGHVFDPKTKLTASHYPRTRLDSVGLFLQTASELIMQGITQDKPYGYKKAEDVLPETANAIANCTAYLQAINYPYSKSTGPWEQWTFDVTPSSDVAVINQAFRNIINLMYSPTDNKELLKVRQQLKETIHGNIFDDEIALRNTLREGEKRIKTNSLQEVPEKRKEDIERCAVCNPPADAEIVANDYQKELSSTRNLDGAMSFIFKTEKLDDNVIENAKKVISRLQSWEYNKENSDGIIREHGVLRYAKDQYLYINQNIEDVENEQAQSQKRYKDMHLPLETQAQWFMTSDISKSYGVLAKSLIDYIKASPQNSNEAKELLKTAIDKETEFINKSYARITGENTLKANAKACPSFKVPEAYQCVEDSAGNKKFVPGINTPLTWAQVSLYDASKIMKENLTEYQKIKASEEIL